MKTIIGEAAQILSQAADRIEASLAARPQAVLVLAANDDCLRLYRELADRFRAGSTALSQARFFSATAFAGLSADDPRCCRMRLKEALLDTVDPQGERTVFLSEDNEADYESLLSEAGGIDLAILGVGERGRVGFNEPGTPFDSPTHRKKLTKASRRELSGLFGGEEKVPDYGCTMGVHTLLGAKELLVVALGEERADPVFRMLYARTDSFVPAAFLQLPPQVTLYADEAAAAKL